MANKKTRKRKALEVVGVDGRSKRLWLVSGWREMPDIRKVRSAFVLPFHQDKLVIVRVDKTRYSLAGGKKERGEKTIQVVVRRECYEEAYATLGKLLPLGYVRVCTKKGKVYYIAYVMADVTHLDDFVPGPESDARFLCNTDGRDLMLANLVGGEDATSWKMACNRELLQEALRRRAA
jgi:8-oxo-dGTP pyrophosphatase MutT (NUDIX family)